MQPRSKGSKRSHQVRTEASHLLCSRDPGSEPLLQSFLLCKRTRKANPSLCRIELFCFIFIGLGWLGSQKQFQEMLPMPPAGTQDPAVQEPSHTSTQKFIHTCLAFPHTVVHRLTYLLSFTHLHSHTFSHNLIHHTNTYSHLNMQIHMHAFIQPYTFPCIHIPSHTH